MKLHRQRARSITGPQPRRWHLDGRLRPFLPEVVDVVLLFLAFMVGAILSPYFLDVPFLLDSTTLYIEAAIMALGMTFVIISGNIDLSVASILALVASLMAVLHVELNVPMEVAIPIALILGTLLGALNGWLIARLRLPALAVTLATLALYRGLAQILLGDHSLSQFPQWFVGIDRVTVPGTPIPIVLIFSSCWPSCSACSCTRPSSVAGYTRWAPVKKPRAIRASRSIG